MFFARSILSIFLFALSLGQDVLGQSTAILTGTVLDAETGEPLPGATVSLLRAGSLVAGTTTDPEGQFTFSSLTAGSATLQVRFVGYKVHEAGIEIGEVEVVSVEMADANLALSAIEIIGESPNVYRKLAGTATKIDPRELDLINPIGTQELLGYVPGIHGFADDGIGNSRISVGIRGLNPRRSSRVLVLEDGIPVQPAIYVYPNMYYNPPVERIDRVEVIKGSAAIKYGPQTMGGVINYITSRPRQSFGASGQLTTGTNNYFSLFSEVGGWGNDVVKPEVQLLLKHGDGFRQNNTFDQYNGTFKLSIVPDDEQAYYIKANVNYENSNATYTGLTEHSFRTDPTFNPKDDDNFRVFRSSLDVIHSRQHGTGWTQTTRGYLNMFDRRWWREKDVFVRAGQFDPADPASIVPVPWYTSGDLLRVGGGKENMGILRTFYVGGVERSYAFQHTLFGYQANLDAGGRLHWERFIDNKKVGDAPDARDGVFYRGNPDDPKTVEILGQSHHYETSALALYAQEEIALGAFTMVPGVRVEIFEQERVDRLQGGQYLDKANYVILPGLGLNYAVGGLNFFGGIHRGYTPPSSGALKITNFGGEIENGGLDLKPEKSWNTELGLRTQLPWLAFEAAAFHLYIEDIVAAGRGTAFKNLGAAQNYGLEWSSTLRASALSGLLPDVNLAYTYLQTEVLEGRIASALRAGGVEVDIAGNELPYAPRHTLTAGLSRNFDFGLDLRADLRFVDRVYTDFENIERTTNRGDTGPVPAYSIIDASARYQISRRLHVLFIVKNMLDEVYVGSRLHSSPGQPEPHLSSGILPGPRRQVNIGLHYRF